MEIKARDVLIPREIWLIIAIVFLVWSGASVYAFVRALTPTIAFSHIKAGIEEYANSRRAERDQETAQEQGAGTASLSVLEQPAAQKLKIEIVRGLVGEDGEPTFIGFTSTFILLRIRVTSTSAPGVTVKRWVASVYKCGEDFASAFPTNLEHEECECCFGHISGDETGPLEKLDKRLDAITSVQAVEHGAATEGWILLKTHLKPHILFGMMFDIEAIDDMDGRSNHVRYPGEWLEPGRFSKTARGATTP
jgi:hypothetical protein